MKQYFYFFLIFIIISIILSHLLTNSVTQEGFNTYFRQSMRPHIRTFRNARDNVTYHFNTKFKDFGRNLGIW